ncbi:MAG: hypothetical protein SVU69_03450 [Pseudomonadota bacterium]|nr:hypothetical protein [Pseudomonadota bacterium]
MPQHPRSITGTGGGAQLMTAMVASWAVVVFPIAGRGVFLHLFGLMTRPFVALVGVPNRWR